MSGIQEPAPDITTEPWIQEPAPDITTEPSIMFVNDAAALQFTTPSCPASNQFTTPSCPTSTVASPRSSGVAPPEPWDLDKIFLYPGRLGLHQAPLRRSSSCNIPLIKQTSAVPEILRDDYVGYIRDSGPNEMTLKRYKH